MLCGLEKKLWKWREPEWAMLEVRRDAPAALQTPLRRARGAHTIQLHQTARNAGARKRKPGCRVLQIPKCAAKRACVERWSATAFLTALSNPYRSLRRHGGDVGSRVGDIAAGYPSICRPKGLAKILPFDPFRISAQNRVRGVEPAFARSPRCPQTSHHGVYDIVRPASARCQPLAGALQAAGAGSPEHCRAPAQRRDEGRRPAGQPDGGMVR